MLAQLGNIKFEGLKTFQKFVETYSVILAQHAHINTRPGLQMVGANLDLKSIDILLHNAFCDVDAELDALKTAMSNGEILPLILGTGEVLGDFSISDMTVDVLQSAPNGKRLIVNVSINILQFFDADIESTKQNSAADNGLAVQDGNIKPIDITPPVPTDGAGGVAVALTNAKVQTDGINVNIKNSVTFSDQADYWYSKISDALIKADGYLSQATDLLNDIQTEVSNYLSLVAAITDTRALIAAFSAIMPPGSLLDLQTANAALQDSAGNLRIACGVVNGLAISRML